MNASARQLRRALERLCRKVNPPHWPTVQSLELPLPPDVTLPWQQLPLTGAYLRGLAPPPGTPICGADLFCAPDTTNHPPPRPPAQGHTGMVWSVAALTDGRIASASDDHTLRIWDPNSGQCLNTLKGHTGRVDSVAALPGGRIVSGGWDGLLGWQHEGGSGGAALGFMG